MGLCRRFLTRFSVCFPSQPVFVVRVHFEFAPRPALASPPPRSLVMSFTRSGKLGDKTVQPLPLPKGGKSRPPSNPSSGVSSPAKGSPRTSVVGRPLPPSSVKLPPSSLAILAQRQPLALTADKPLSESDTKPEPAVPHAQSALSEVPPSSTPTRVQLLNLNNNGCDREAPQLAHSVHKVDEIKTFSPQPLAKCQSMVPPPAHPAAPESEVPPPRSPVVVARSPPALQAVAAAVIKQDEFLLPDSSSRAPAAPIATATHLSQSLKAATEPAVLPAFLLEPRNRRLSSSAPAPRTDVDRSTRVADPATAARIADLLTMAFPPLDGVSHEERVRRAFPEGVPVNFGCYDDFQPGELQPSADSEEQRLGLEPSDGDLNDLLESVDADMSHEPAREGTSSAPPPYAFTSGARVAPQSTSPGGSQSNRSSGSFSSGTGDLQPFTSSPNISFSGSPYRLLQPDRTSSLFVSPLDHSNSSGSGRRNSTTSSVDNEFEYKDEEEVRVMEQQGPAAQQPSLSAAAGGVFASTAMSSVDLQQFPLVNASLAITRCVDPSRCAFNAVAVRRCHFPNAFNRPGDLMSHLPEVMVRLIKPQLPLGEPVSLLRRPLSVGPMILQCECGYFACQYRMKCKCADIHCVWPEFIHDGKLPPFQHTAANL